MKQTSYELRLFIYRILRHIPNPLPTLVRAVRFRRKLRVRAYREVNRWFVSDFNGYSKYANELVAGVPEIIQLLAGKDAEKVQIDMNDHCFPDSVRLDLISTDSSGSTYQYFDGTRLWQGWLCPVFFWYFRQPPHQLHIRIIPR